MFPEYPDIYNYTQEIKATFNCKFLIQNNNNKTVGHFLCLAMLEKYDMIWKSYMFNLKKGPLKFLLNPCLETLPTQTTLLQWGKSGGTTILLKISLD